MPAFKHRAIMLDPARTCDTLEQYHELLPLLKDWGYDTLHWHFADDQGCRLVFPSHPELASRGAFTVEQTRDLIRRAGDLGIRVIPEIECYGHVRFITGHPDYQDLGDPEGDHFNAIDPRNPRSQQVLRDLLTDAAEVFPDPCLHVGLDEVNIRALSAYRDISEAQASQMFADHTNWVLDVVRGLGRRPAMWGDHLWKDPRIADQVANDVLIFDWHYDEDPPHQLDFFTQRGFETWAAPATFCWYARVVTNRRNLLNLRNLTGEAKLRRRQGVTGMVNTVWTPWRFLPGATDWPSALAGHLFDADQEDPAFCVDFARQLYGFSASDAKRCADALHALHEHAPWGGVYDSIVVGEGWRQRFHAEHARQAAIIEKVMGEVRQTLERLIPKARRHASRLNDVLLSARVLERVGQFGVAQRKKKALPDGKPLWNAVETRWKETRVHGWRGDAHAPRQRDRLMYMLKKLV